MGMDELECGGAVVRECGSAGVRECGSAGVRECGGEWITGPLPILLTISASHGRASVQSPRNHGGGRCPVVSGQ